VAFLSRARAFFAAHGIHRVVRVVTDNGANFRAAAFERALIPWVSRHQRTRPYTPRHNGKVEEHRAKPVYCLDVPRHPTGPACDRERL
jgi:transposase InsO family protein